MSVEISNRPIHTTIPEMKASIVMQLKGITQYIPVWVGDPGIGKTALMSKIADDLEMDLYYVSGAKPVEYWSGLPITNTLQIDENSDTTSYCLWTEPEPIHVANFKARNNTHGCIMFIDDAHIIDGQAQKVFFEFILERSLHGHKLDQNVAIVAAMNGSEDSGNEGFYAAIVNRFNWIHVHMDFNFWYVNVGYKLHPYIGGFLKNNHSRFISETERTDGPFGTFRTWTELGKAVDFATKYNIYGNEKMKIEDIIYYMSKGYVTNEAATELRKSVIVQKKFDFENMVKNKTFNFNANSIEDQILFSNVIRYLENKEDFDAFKDYLFDLSEDDISKYKNMFSFLMLDIKTLQQAYKNSTDEKEKIKYKNFYMFNIELLNNNKISELCADIYSI